MIVDAAIICLNRNLVYRKVEVFIFPDSSTGNGVGSVHRLTSSTAGYTHTHVPNGVYTALPNGTSPAEAVCLTKEQLVKQHKVGSSHLMVFSPSIALYTHTHTHERESSVYKETNIGR